MCGMTRSYVLYDSSYVRYDMIRVTYFICMCDMTELIMCVTWLIYMCDNTYLYRWHDMAQ